MDQELLEKYEALSKSYIDLTIDYSKAKEELQRLRKEERRFSSDRELYCKDRAEWSNENARLLNEIETLKEGLQQAQEKLLEPHAEPHNARGAGRKPKLNDEQRAKVKDLSVQGLSIRKIATIIGASPATILRCLKD